MKVRVRTNGFSDPVRGGGSFRPVNPPHRGQAYAFFRHENARVGPARPGRVMEMVSRCAD